MLTRSLSVLSATFLFAGCVAGPTLAADAVAAKTDLANGVTDDAIKIGWMGDETGPSAGSGIPVLRGLQAYIEYTNGRGGLLGHKIQLIDLDDKSMPESGTVNFRRLLNDDRVLAIGNMGASGIATALAPAVNAAKIPVVFPFQTIDAQLKVPYFFNIMSHYADQADVMVAQAIKTLTGRVKMFVVRLNVPSGEEFDVYIQRALKTQGGDYLGNSTISYGQNEYTPTIVQIKQAMDAGANVVVFHGATRNAVGIFNAISKAGIQVPVIGIYSLATPDVFTLGPQDVMKTVTAVSSVQPASSGAPGGKEILEFVRANQRFAKDAEDPLFSQGWITGQVLKTSAEKAAKENGGTLTRATLYNALQSKFDTGGLSCNLDFTSKNYTPCATILRWNGKGFVADDFSTFDKVLQRKYGL